MGSAEEDRVRVLGHRQRREIMRVLHASEAPLGTAELAEGLGGQQAKIAYHARVLQRWGLIAPLPAGDPMSGRYVSRVRDHAAIAVFLDEQD